MLESFLYKNITDRTEQASLLVQSPHVVVGTPGRVCFHLMNTPGISLRKLRFLVS